MRFCCSGEVGEEPLSPEMSPDMAAPDDDVSMAPPTSDAPAEQIMRPEYTIPETPPAEISMPLGSDAADVLSTQWMPRYWYGFQVSVDPITGMQDITKVDGDTSISLDNYHYPAYRQSLTDAHEYIQAQVSALQGEHVSPDQSDQQFDAQLQTTDQHTVDQPSATPSGQPLHQHHPPLPAAPQPNRPIYSDVADNEAYVQAQRAILSMSSAESVGWATSLWDSAVRFAGENLVCKRVSVCQRVSKRNKSPIVAEQAIH